MFIRSVLIRSHFRSGALQEAPVEVGRFDQRVSSLVRRSEFRHLFSPPRLIPETLRPAVDRRFAPRIALVESLKRAYENPFFGETDLLLRLSRDSRHRINGSELLEEVVRVRIDSIIFGTLKLNPTGACPPPISVVIDFARSRLASSDRTVEIIGTAAVLSRFSRREKLLDQAGSKALGSSRIGPGRGCEQ